MNGVPNQKLQATLAFAFLLAPAGRPSAPELFRLSP